MTNDALVPPRRTVGVVGLGAMGGLIATALYNAGEDVVVFDVNATAVTLAADRGLSTAGSVAELGERSEVVILSLPTPPIVSSVVAELCRGSSVPMVLDTSTIGPETAQHCRAVLIQVGGDYADCPILGRSDAVGKWTIPVGGAPELAGIAADVFRPVARQVVRVGETGAGATLKVLNNLMLGTINAITAEVLVLSEAAGLDPGVFVDTVVDSGAASVSGLFRDVGPRAVEGDFTPKFSLALMRKDVGLALALADQHGIPMPVGAAVQALNTMAVSSGLGGEDSIAVVKLLEQLTGQVARRHAPRLEE